MLLVTSLFPLTACNQTDYQSYLSEIRSDLFVAETQEFSLQLACISREKPYQADGIPCERTDFIEITLKDLQGVSEYRVFICGEKQTGGEMTFRNVTGDYYYSEGVTEFPEGTVSLRVEWGDEVREIAATSVKNERTISPAEALSFAIQAETERVESMKQQGVFCGEFYVRLLRRERNYYYVGIIDREGCTLSLLLDAETGSVLAKHENG